MKHIKKLLVIMAIATLILSMAIATASATSQVKNEKKDTEIVKIESKEKTTKYKITWKGNGGKIGTKKTVTTTVKKGSKIGKLITPKRSGYTLKGWYTKKTGGTKITKNMKPKKSATLYAQWQKKSSSRVLNAEEKKFVGAWSAGPYLPISNSNRWIEFKNDGTFKRENSNIGRVGQVEGYWYNSGNWKVVGNKIVCTNIKETYKRKGDTVFVGDYKNRPIANQNWNYYFSNEDGLTWLNINHYPGDKELSRVEYYVKPTLV